MLLLVQPSGRQYRAVASSTPSLPRTVYRSHSPVLSGPPLRTHRHGRRDTVTQRDTKRHRDTEAHRDSHRHTDADTQKHRHEYTKSERERERPGAKSGRRGASAPRGRAPPCCGGAPEPGIAPSCVSATPPRNHRQETASSVQVVPGMRFLACAFAVLGIRLQRLRLRGHGSPGAA